MNLRTLKYFIAIADAGSFTGAASPAPEVEVELVRSA